MEQFTLFWNGPFSQWDTSEFEFEGIRFNRAEQFMMLCKATFFKDYESANRVMAIDDPKEQKKIGRQVKGFDIDAWAEVARDLVYVGSYCKFTQSNEHNDALMKTGSTTLVEASPYDKVWGIGLSEYSPLALRRETWEGKNWLGEVVTQVREDLLADNKNEAAFELAKQLMGKYKSSRSSAE